MNYLTTRELILRSAVEAFANMGFSLEEIEGFLFSRLEGNAKSKNRKSVRSYYNAILHDSSTAKHIPSISQIKNCVMSNDKLTHRMWKRFYCENFNLPFHRIRGVYKIGNSYIGATSNLKRRLKSHHRLLERGQHTNQVLQDEYHDLVDRGIKIPIYYLDTDPNKEQHYKQKYNLFNPDGELFYYESDVNTDKLLFTNRRFLKNYDSKQRLISDIKNTWNVFDITDFGSTLNEDEVIGLIL